MKTAHLSSFGNRNPSDTNPQHVLQSIGATRGAGTSADNLEGPVSTSESIDREDRHWESQEGPKVQSCSEAKTVPSLRLVVAPDSETAESQTPVGEIDILQSTIESAKQIQQLAQRLKNTQNELAQRESKLDASIQVHQQSIVQQQHLADRHLSQLQQQTSQVRLQQRQVMQLQTAVVQSNAAVKIAIEQLVSSELTDATTLNHMKAIQHELTDRFNFISRRWKHLFNLLENQRVQLEAAESLRESA